VSCPIRSDIDFGAYLAEPRAPEWAGFREHYPTCPECSRELARWTDLEALLRLASAPAEPAHPSEEALLAFQGRPRDLAPEKRRSIAGHLSACALCRDALAAVASLDPGMLAPEQPLAKASPGLLSRMAEALRSVIQLPPARAPALAIVSLLVLIPVALLLWSTWKGPAAKGPTAAPGAEVAAVEPAPEPEAGAAPVEAREEPALVAATEEEEPPEVPGAAEPSAASEEPAAPAEVAAVEPPPQPEPRPALAKKPTELTPAQPREQVEEEEPEGAKVLLLAALAESGPPLYVPQSGELPGVRVGSEMRSVGAGLPTVLAVAPSHVGLTAEASPTLYWFLSEDSNVPAQFSLSDPDAIDPILEFDIPAPIEAGLHAVRLSERGVVLQPGTQYRWFVSLVPDAARRSRDVIAGGAIDRIQPGEKLRAELEAADPAELGHVYARNGLWYDSLGFLSGWIEQYPQEPRLRAQRAALLEQVGLEEAAAWERRAAQLER